jgi:hypothetical protein
VVEQGDYFMLFPIVLLVRARDLSHVALGTRCLFSRICIGTRTTLLG